MANKSDLVNKVQEISNENGLELNKKETAIAVESVIEAIKQFLGKHEPVSIVDFGKFEVRERAARMGHNPQNPEQKIEIPETFVPAFKAGKALKDLVKQ